jgi:Fe-S oxidoreductase
MRAAPPRPRRRSTRSGWRSPTAATAYRPSCQSPELATDAVTLLERAGIGHVAVAAPPRACGGYPLLAAGQHDAFRLHAEELGRALGGHRRLIVHCPACAWALKTVYPRFGVPLVPTVEHVSEALAPAIGRLPIVEARRRERALYHDPCYLGRHLGLYDAPRALARAGARQVDEFARARHEAECSGGGGLLPITMPTTARAIAGARLDEAKEAGVATIVTACTTCKRQLTSDGVTALDLIELLRDATAPA